MNRHIALAIAALIAAPAGAIDLASFDGKGLVERCYENPTDPQHRRVLLQFRAPTRDQFGFSHRLVEGWERTWNESGGEHPTLLYGSAVMFPINNGEYDLIQVRLTRSFPGSDIDGDTWYFDDYQGHVGGYHYEVACDAPWPISQGQARSARSARSARGGFATINR